MTTARFNIASSLASVQLKWENPFAEIRRSMHSNCKASRSKVALMYLRRKSFFNSYVFPIASAAASLCSTLHAPALHQFGPDLANMSACAPCCAMFVDPAKISDSLPLLRFTPLLQCWLPALSCRFQPFVAYNEKVDASISCHTLA